MNKYVDMYDMEQAIMQCWNVLDDFEMIEQTIEDEQTLRQQAVIELRALREYYDMKFRELLRIHTVLLQEKFKDKEDYSFQYDESPQQSLFDNNYSVTSVKVNGDEIEV